MKIKKISGIQKKYLTYIMLLLILALFLSCIGVWSYVRNDMAAVIVDKYEFMNEKMGMSMDNLYKNSNEATAECIINDDVQKSLRTKGLEGVERYALGKYFAYVDLDYITEYCYVDNKKNVYTKSYSKISYDDFEKSGFSDILSDEYSKTEWFWTKDTLFGTEKEALFVGRYVRSMDYAHEPGMLFFKMDPRFLESVLKDAEGGEKEAVAGIVDKNGKLCIERAPEGFEISSGVKREVAKLSENKESGVILKGGRIQEGILQAYRQKDSGMIVFTLVPNAVLYSGLNRILLVHCIIDF